MIGDRLTKLRKRAGLSQKELGECVEVSHYTISAYEKERSEPPDEVKVQIARFFGVSVDYLLGLIEEPLPYNRSAVGIHISDRLSSKAQHLLKELYQELSEDNQKS